MGTGCKLTIAELACKTMQLSICWNNDGYSRGGALISHECSYSGCSALDLGHYLHDCEEDSLLSRL